MSKKSKFLKTEAGVSEETNHISEANLSGVLEDNIREYGMSVIEDRMIPSIRDGLKPSQRRLLKAMYDLRAWNTSPTVKSARVCGDTIGKYHPHGECYGALAGLVNQTYSLVQGQGNWGSLDDEPAAPRYTECRYSKLGQHCFENYSVAEEIPNFSGEYFEPIDVPMDFPMFFVNGGKGIGVAVRFETPDHNLEEVVNALKIVLKKGEKTKMEDLFKVFHGPDSVYGGKLLTSKEELKQIYETGTGKISYECDYQIEPQGRDKFLLTVTGYCPGFKPSTFQNAMIKLMADNYVLDANDASTKENACNFQVIYKGEATFESKIHKSLICSQTIQYYALDRRKSKNPELRDVDTILLQKPLIGYMQIWLDWRREQEAKLLDIRAKEIDDKIFRVECRMCAAENLKVIQAALNADDAETHLMKNLPYLIGHPRAKEGAEYILDLKIGSIKKTDMQKMRLEFGALDQELQRVNKDKNDIDKVVSRKLDALKEFFKPRMLKVKD
jgi:DNA gyrase/topoisomerase IV subunit A